MIDTIMTNERLAQLFTLEEDRFIAGFHQKVQKAREKSWHDRHVKKKIFQIGDLVLLYDSKFVKFPKKFKTHWLQKEVPFSYSKLQKEVPFSSAN